jgi:hypothetical protein
VRYSALFVLGFFLDECLVASRLVVVVVVVVVVLPPPPAAVAHVVTRTRAVRTTIVVVNPNNERRRNGMAMLFLRSICSIRASSCGFVHGHSHASTQSTASGGHACNVSQPPQSLNQLEARWVFDPSMSLTHVRFNNTPLTSTKNPPSRTLMFMPHPRHYPGRCE